MSNSDRGELRLHGTCVAYDGQAALLRGKPGSGKSDLALRFISMYGVAPGGREMASLVADDQVILSLENDWIMVRAPEATAGRIEVRGVGIMRTGHAQSASLALIVDLQGNAELPRLPPDPLPWEIVLGHPVPVIALDPFEPSSPIKLKLALTGSI